MSLQHRYLVGNKAPQNTLQCQEPIQTELYTESFSGLFVNDPRQDTRLMIVYMSVDMKMWPQHVACFCSPLGGPSNLQQQMCLGVKKYKCRMYRPWQICALMWSSSEILNSALLP